MFVISKNDFNVAINVARGPAAANHFCGAAQDTQGGLGMNF